MNIWVWITACCVCAGLAAQTLSVGLKLRIALGVAQWSALVLIGVRVAVYAVTHTVA